MAKLAKAARGGLITVAAAGEALALDRRNASLKLASLARRGWMLRARRGLYLILPLEAEPGRPRIAEDPWVLAREAFSPSYIGGWSAAEHWGLTEQIFRSTLVITAAPVRSRTLRLLGYEFQLFRVPLSRINGSVLIWRGAQRIPVSDPEHTIVDCLRYPELCGGVRHLIHILREYWNSDKRNVSKLATAARAAHSGAVWKRLGFLIDHLWPQEQALIKEAQRHLTSGNIKLDPKISRKGKLNYRWRIWANMSVTAAAGDE
jgi:predicted transcriptional regulator of viral defense system